MEPLVRMENIQELRPGASPLPGGPDAASKSTLIEVLMMAIGLGAKTRGIPPGVAYQIGRGSGEVAFGWPDPQTKVRPEGEK